MKRTPENEWKIKCCSNCKYATINYYDKEHYYCRFKCSKVFKEVETDIIGYLDKHYCDSFEKEVRKKRTN